MPPMEPGATHAATIKSAIVAPVSPPWFSLPTKCTLPLQHPGKVTATTVGAALHAAAAVLRLAAPAVLTSGSRVEVGTPNQTPHGSGKSL